MKDLKTFTFSFKKLEDMTLKKTYTLFFLYIISKYNLAL